MLVVTGAPAEYVEPGSGAATSSKDMPRSLAASITGGKIVLRATRLRPGNIRGVIEIGCHFDIANVTTEAAAAGATAAQVFLSDPQKWPTKTIAYPGGADGLKHDAAAAHLPLYVHAPYLINLATLTAKGQTMARNMLRSTISGAASIGAKGVVVHGGHVAAKADPIAGFLSWKDAVDTVYAPGATRGSVPIFIENTAGGNNAMARELDRIAVLWEAISHSEYASEVGFCLDTCHAWAAGWDLTTAVHDIKKITGRLDLIHLNDSRDAAGSGADRHAPLGQGHIPAELLVNIVKEAKCPVIIETHGNPTTEIDWLKARL